MLQLEVRYFASLAERAGTQVESIEIDPSSDVRSLWQLLVRRHPAFAEITYRPLVACDQIYTDWDAHLDGVSEIAFLPPVSGG